MTRPTHFQKGIAAVLLLGFVGFIGYMGVLNQSIQSDREKMQSLSEHVLQAPEMVEARQKNERDRRLLRAIREDDVEQIKLLLQQGITPKTFIAGQPIALHAVSYGAEQVWAFLLARGADTNAQNAQGTTLLMEAVKQGQPKMVTSLLAHGAKADAVDDQGRTLLMYAGLNRANITGEMHTGEVHWDMKTARLILEPLIAQGATIDAVDRERRTTLRYAVASGQLPLVRILLDRGAKPDEGLFLAVRNGNLEIVQVLLAAGANPNQRDRDVKGTMLHYARAHVEESEQKERRRKIIQVLIKAGAKDASF